MICSRGALRQPLSLLYARISQSNDNLAGFILRERESGGTRFLLPCHPLVSVSVASNIVPFHSPFAPSSRRSPCSPATVFLANSPIASFAREASTPRTIYVNGYPRPRSYIEFSPRQLSGKWLLLSH